MTAVEWLVSKVLVKSEGEWIDEPRIEYINAYKGHVDLSNYVADALEMEKQQQGYSEEDMRKAFEWGVAHITFEEWIKQFKNK